MENEKTTISPNPWLNIWLKPKETIQNIIDTNPEYGVLLITSWAGITNVFGKASEKSLGDNYGLYTIILVALFLGPIIAVIGLYIGAYLIRLTGGWLNGTGNFSQVRAAVAWSNVPLMIMLVLTVLEIIIFGEELFSSYMPRTWSNDLLYYTLWGFIGLEVILGIWSIVIIVASVAQVHDFSIWRSIGALLLVALLFVAVAIVVGISFAIIVH